jgi:hypothetical protein
MLSNVSKHSSRLSQAVNSRVNSRASLLSVRSNSYKSSYKCSSSLASSNELVDFSAVDETKPILLNSKEHAIEYLSQILNAKVYEAAIETDLQHAKNLSAVSDQTYKCVIMWIMYCFDFTSTSNNLTLTPLTNTIMIHNTALTK